MESVIETVGAVTGKQLRESVMNAVGEYLDVAPDLAAHEFTLADYADWTGRNRQAAMRDLRLLVDRGALARAFRHDGRVSRRVFGYWLVSDGKDGRPGIGLVYDDD